MRIKDKDQRIKGKRRRDSLISEAARAEWVTPAYIRESAMRLPS